MHTEVLKQFDMPWLPVTALILFVTCFLAYTYWTYKKDNKKFYENSSYMPLEDGVKHER